MLIFFIGKSFLFLNLVQIIFKNCIVCCNGFNEISPRFTQSCHVVFSKVIVIFCSLFLSTCTNSFWITCSAPSRLRPTTTPTGRPWCNTSSCSSRQKVWGASRLNAATKTESWCRQVKFLLLSFLFPRKETLCVYHIYTHPEIDNK